MFSVSVFSPPALVKTDCQLHTLKEKPKNKQTKNLQEKENNLSTSQGFTCVSQSRSEGGYRNSFAYHLLMI